MEEDSLIAFDSEASYVWLTALPFASCGGLIVQSAAMVIKPEGLHGLERVTFEWSFIADSSKAYEGHLQTQAQQLQFGSLLPNVWYVWVAERNLVVSKKV